MGRWWVPIWLQWWPVILITDWKAESWFGCNWNRFWLANMVLETRKLRILVAIDWRSAIWSPIVLIRKFLFLTFLHFFIFMINNTLEAPFQCIYFFPFHIKDIFRLGLAPFQNLTFEFTFLAVQLNILFAIGWWKDFQQMVNFDIFQIFWWKIFNDSSEFLQ